MFKLTTCLALATASVLALTAPALAAEKSDKPTKYEEKIEEATIRPSVTETATTTSHSLSLKGKVINYKATAGTLVINEASGKPEGSLFYVAYTVEPAKGEKRPVTFLFNGGPGSASLWLHMGSVGPVFVKTSSPDNTKPSPYSYGTNPNTLLDKSDLVFIDAMGAGYSRPLGDAKGDRFYGVDQDVSAFKRAIQRYIKINDRWNSPKFILGESYGTLRAPALVNALQGEGLDFNGVILLSSILNYGVRQPGYDQNDLILMPTYAAAAWYHNAIPNKPADLETFLKAAREFAAGPYASALAKGTSISAEEEDAVARQLSGFIGIRPEYLKQGRLRISLNRFRKELLRNKEMTVGRLDMRFLGVDEDSAGERPEFDASDTAITSAYYSALNAYLSSELNYRTELEYRLSARGSDFKWDWKHRFGQMEMNNPNTALDLGNAMRTNPNLKVLSMYGYYDAATPFFSTEYDLHHIGLEPAQIKNISHTYYPAGHMFYVDEGSHAKMKADLDFFYDSAK